jgi:hypothetical protein
MVTRTEKNTTSCCAAGARPRVHCAQCLGPWDIAPSAARLRLDAGYLLCTVELISVRPLQADQQAGVTACGLGAGFKAGGDINRNIGLGNFVIPRPTGSSRPPNARCFSNKA